MKEATLVSVLQEYMALDVQLWVNLVRNKVRRKVFKENPGMYFLRLASIYSKIDD